MKRGTCATCAFFEDVKGECRFNPPTLVVTHPVMEANQRFGAKPKMGSRWPQVDSDDWCSHWQSAIVDGKRKTWNYQLNEED